MTAALTDYKRQHPVPCSTFEHFILDINTSFRSLNGKFHKKTMQPLNFLSVSAPATANNEAHLEHIHVGPPCLAEHNPPAPRPLRVVPARRLKPPTAIICGRPYRRKWICCVCGGRWALMCDSCCLCFRIMCGRCKEVRDYY